MSEHPLRTRILLADDHTVVRRGLRMVLETAPDLDVVAEASDGIEAVERALREDIDLVILDVAMPRRTGLQAARELARRRPELKLLMLSMHEVEQYFFEALKAGASGYVLKTAAGRDLVEACRAAMRGEPFLYPPAVRGIMRDYLERAADHSPGPTSFVTKELRVTPTRSITTKSSRRRRASRPSLALECFKLEILATYVTDWLGADNVRQFGVQFREQVWPGDVLTCSGAVTEVHEAGGERRADLELQVTLVRPVGLQSRALRVL